MANPLMAMFKNTGSVNQSLQTILLNQMKARNPEGYKVIMEAKTKGISPQSMIKDMMKNATPEQIQQVTQQAQSLGVPNNILKQFQNFK